MERLRALGRWGEQKGNRSSEKKWVQWFSDVRELNTDFPNHPFGDINATRVARRHRAMLAWVAISVISERQSFSAYFGSIKQIEEHRERFSIPMGPDKTPRHESLPREELDRTIHLEWSNGGYHVGESNGAIMSDVEISSEIIASVRRELEKFAAAGKLPFASRASSTRVQDPATRSSGRKLSIERHHPDILPPFPLLKFAPSLL